jgi:hypothetical protein
VSDYIWKRLDACRSDDGDGSRGTIVPFGYEALSDAVRELIAEAHAAGKRDGIEAAAKEIADFNGSNFGDAQLIRALLTEEKKP